MERMRKFLIVLAAAVVLAVAGVVMYLRSRPLNTAQQVALAYLQRWQAQDWKGMQALVDRPPPTFTAVHAQMVNDLSVSNLRITPGNLVVSGGTAQKPFTVDVALKGLGTWSYNGTLHLVRPARRWKVSWTPETVHPQLASDRKFARVLHWPDRAPILGRDGTVLQGQGDVVSVGVEPDRIKDPGAVIAAFQQYAGIDATTVNRVLHTPGARPSWFLQVTQMHQDQFAALPPAFIQTPGIVVQRTKARTPLRDGFASHVLGTTGPITAERLAQLGPPYVTGTVVGLSGLEGALERQLAGSPTADIQIVDTAGSVIATLDHFDGSPPQPVTTTLDPAVQTAADNTLAGSTQTAALVALDAATGEIRAVVSRPLNGFDRALAGTYPPGSTMKIVTTEALLVKGDDLTTPISCPTDVVVDGKHFHNIEGEGGTQLNLQQAFVQSCNTAFVQLAATLKASELTRAADNLGFNAPEPLPLTSKGSSFPPPKDLADQAGAAIGQAEVLATPLHMASVAAAVASGAWHQPTLTAGASATATVTPLDPGVAGKLRTLMGLVVSDPSGTGILAKLPGTSVSGKTGTAEFGNANPPRTHAWFVGFRGNLAFAVLVEGGGVGGKVAAPLAAKFLSQLPG
jgi:cell division protein FtsI/penicillin-binding protein 2